MVRWGDGGRGSGEERGTGKRRGGWAGGVSAGRRAGEGCADEPRGRGRTTSVVQRTISRERAMEGAVSTRVTFSPHDIFNPPRAATARPRI